MMQSVRGAVELKIDLPYKCIYPSMVTVSIDWPASIRYMGNVYHWYDKLGIDDAGMPCACYKYYYDGVSIMDKRIWLHCDGRIIED